MPSCRHCGSPAVARFKTPQGCVCFPEDREQDLCMQHIIKDGMLGEGVEVVADYTIDKDPLAWAKTTTVFVLEWPRI
jgi:hypothetical protein